MKKYKFALPIKYLVNKTINDILLRGQSYKRIAQYKEAAEIYELISEIDGPSGLLYIAMAKNLACQMKYEDAIELFELANESSKKELGFEDENCLYHIEQLKNKNSIPEEKFLDYMKGIAGNPNYTFPEK